MKTIKFLFTAVIIGLTLTSCNKDNDDIIDVDFEAQFEQLGVGGFGIDSDFATLDFSGSKGDAWNTRGLSFGDMLSKVNPSSSKATSTFSHVYYDHGTIGLKTATTVQNQTHLGYFMSTTGVANAGAGLNGRSAWTAYIGSEGDASDAAYAYALQPGEHVFAVKQVGTEPILGPSLGFEAELTYEVVAGDNPSQEIALTYDQALITIVFPTGTVTTTTISTEDVEADSDLSAYTMTAAPGTPNVLYVYSKDVEITTISFGGTTFDASSLPFALSEHQNFNVVFNSSGGFTIEPGGNWALTDHGAIPGI